MEVVPKVSVIIPVYNAEKYLRQCLDSVIGQTLQEIEIICIDDGSTDRSLAILHEYENADSRITVLTQENGYAGVARNYGMSVAKGEYLSFLDSDDYFEPSLLEKTYQQAKRIDADIVMCGAKRYHQKTGKTENMPWALDMNYLPTKQPFSRKDIPYNIFQITTSAPWSKLFKRAFIQAAEIQFQDTRNSNDLYFTAAALALADKIGYVNEPLVYYRVGQSNTIQLQKDQSPKDFYKALCAVREKLQEQGLYLDLKESFLKSVVSHCDHNFKTISLDALSLEERDEIMQEFIEGVPSISVIVPVYNMEKYIRECLESVLNQKLDNIEVIVVNDGSTDHSLEILKDYAKQDPRIVILDQNNQGVFAARNRALWYSHGEYVCFMDPDDFYPDNGTLELLYQKAKENQARICGGSFSEYRNGTVKKSFEEKNAKYSFSREGFINYRDYQFDYGYHRFIYDRKLLIDNQIFFPPYKRFQDPPFFVKAMVAAGAFYAVPQVVYRYRVGHQTSIRNLPADKLQDMLRGYLDNMLLSKRERLEELHRLTLERLESDYVCNTLMERLREKDGELLKLLIELNDAVDVELLQEAGLDLEGEKRYIIRELLELEGTGKMALSNAIFKSGKNDKRQIPVYIHNCQAYTATNIRPKASVIIPVYNVEAYLKECLESVIHQTLQEIEIICVNDGSLDDSLSIIEEYAKNDDRITVISQNNAGLSGARNAGMDNAHGEYIYFLDSDDYIQLDALEKLYVYSKENELDVLCFGADSFFENAELQKQKPGYADYYHRSKSMSDQVMKGEFLFYRMINEDLFRSSVPLQFIRFDLLKQIDLRFKVGIIHEDELFSPILLLHSQRAACITDNFFMRRIRDDSIMTNTQNTIKHFAGYFIVVFDLWSAFQGVSDISVFGQEALMKRVKALYANTISRYKKLSGGEIAQLASILPEEYLFLFNELNYGKCLPIKKLEKVVPKSNSEGALRAMVVQLNCEITNIHQSASYRIGRFITFIPRKIRGGIRCYKEHGMRYTLNRVREKFGALLGR